MVFPQTRLPAKVQIAPGGSPAQAMAAWPLFVDITNDVRVADGIVITDGRSNESNKIDPGTLSMTLDNRSGNYVPRNPLGTYYGRLRRNTPIKVSVTAGVDTFSRTVAAGGWGVNDSGLSYALGGVASNWSVAGGVGLYASPAAGDATTARMTGAEAYDVEGQVVASVPVTATGGALVVAALARYETGGANYYIFHMEFMPGGTMQLKISRNKASSFGALATLSTGIGSYTPGQSWTLAYAAVGGNLMVKAWPTASAEPAAWQLSTFDSYVSPGRTSGLFFWRVAGNTNVGSVSYSIDSMTIDSVEAVDYVSEWPVRWDQSGRDSTAPLRASGILRRLLQGSTPLRSPLYRQLSSQQVAGYWPFEDDSPPNGTSPTAAASAVQVAPGASVTGVTFAADATLPGSLQNAKLASASARVTAKTPRRLTGVTGFSAMIMLKFPAALTGDSELITIATTGLVQKWVVRVNATGITLTGYDSGGTLVVSPAGTLYSMDPTKWWALQLEADVVGANTEWSLLWHEVGKTDYWSQNGSHASTVVSVPASMSLAANSFTNGVFFSHIYLGSNALPFVTDSFSLVSNGYIGEMAAARIARLCTEEGVPVVVEEGTSQACGQQRIDALLPLLRAAEDADLGVLYETGGGLGYRPGSARYSRPVTLALDRNAGHLAAPPEPTDDDQYVRNDWTLSRDGGAQGVRYVDAAHVTAYGKYDDSATINIDSDDPLLDHAAFRVYLGTRDLLRWSSISLNLARNPSLIPAWRSSLPWGTRLTVANEPAQVMGNAPDVIVEGRTQLLNFYEWSVDLNCSPAQPWDIPPLDDSAMRMDTESATLAAGATTTATSLSVATGTSSTTGQADKLWVTTAANPAEFPFDIGVSGERMTVTAIVGATSPQTFTVVRSVNGVVKAQLSGADVRLWQPTYLAL